MKLWLSELKASQVRLSKFDSSEVAREERVPNGENLGLGW